MLSLNACADHDYDGAEPCPDCAKERSNRLNLNIAAVGTGENILKPGMDYRDIKIKELESKLAATEQPIRRMAALEEALTPSPDTKGAYSGEFYLTYPSPFYYEETGEMETHNTKLYISWTTIKDIMKKIRETADKL